MTPRYATCGTLIFYEVVVDVKPVPDTPRGGSHSVGCRSANETQKEIRVTSFLDDDSRRRALTSRYGGASL